MDLWKGSGGGKLTPIPMPGFPERATAGESKLGYLGHALVENRNGLIAAAMVTHADGHAEREQIC